MVKPARAISSAWVRPTRRGIGLEYFLREAGVPGLAAVAGQMDVDIGHAGHDRAAALVDDGRARRRGEAVLDPGDPAILDDDRRRAARRLGRVDDQAPGLDRVGFGVGADAASSAAAPASRCLEHEVPSLEGRRLSG